MRASLLVGTTFLALACLLAGCVPAAPLAGGGGSAEAPGATKRITAAIMGEPKAVGLGASLSAVPGEDELTELLNSGLTTNDSQGRVIAKLAETVPTVQNGLWTIFPDGGMETTWKIRTTARWHDGAPFTAEDLVFTSQVARDRDLTVATNVGYQAVESIEATDPATLIVRWKRPYVPADTLFDSGNSPLPQHLLQQPYMEDKATFQSLPYWTEQFVGTGPFKLRDWVRGSHVLIVANDQYTLGRPKLDEIEVKFILDQETLIANVLAGAAQMTMGRGIGLEQALQFKQQWTEGRIVTGAGNPVVMFVQFLNPTPTAVADPRFRRGLLTAIDRQGMVDTLLGGLSRVAYGAVRLTEADRQEVSDSIVRYEYDPRRATQVFADAGYTRNADGPLRDRAGEPITMEVHTTPSNDIQPKSAFVVADNWTRVGINTEPVIIPPQRLQDPAYKIDFKAFSVRRNPVTLDRLAEYFSSAQIPAVDNNFRGSNYGGYTNLEVDGLIGRLSMTVPKPERAEIARQILHTLSDQVAIIGLFPDVEVTLIGNHISGVTGRSADYHEPWNAAEWDVTN